MAANPGTKAGAKSNTARKPRAKAKAPKLTATAAGTPRKRKARPGEGRPRKFKAEYIEQARKLTERGATVMEIADFFGVNPSTIWRWAQDDSEFCKALDLADAAATDRVKRSLYERAVGYTFVSEKITIDAKSGKVTRTPYREHVPPDVSAASLWLRNKAPNDWRERSEQVHSGGVTIRIDAADESV